MPINLGSVMNKVNNYASSPAGRKKISNVISGVGIGNGDLALRRIEMIMASHEMIALLRQHAASAGLPASVMSHVESFVANIPKVNDDGSGIVAISMGSNPSRPSLYPEKYDGAYNIVALFNNGYDASGVVYGHPNVEIDGQQSINGFFYTKSKQHRDGLGFMQSAVAEFNAKCGSKYNVTAVLGGSYG